ncbi:segregation/condensation protein A [candidate division FCPU426 bacterium]|nr:segregation/condensation protein A [candidate division FCPU426 bacterium]
MSYRLNLDVFDGPFDLLLYLIKKNEIDIYDIPIAKILAEYLEYVEMIKELDLEMAGDFILMASTLMHIKSRMLLPRESLALEEGEEADPRADLVRRLMEYKRYREVAEGLDTYEQQQRQIFWRRGVQPDEAESEKPAQEAEPVQFQEVNLFDLLSAFKRVLAFATPETFKEIRREAIKISQKINEILDALEENPSLEFIEYMKTQDGRIAMVAALLALLELARLKAIRIVQEKMFAKILIHRVDEFTAAAREAISGRGES